MGLEILSAEGNDARRWTDLIHALPPDRRDIHFLPDYGRIYRDSYGFEPMLAVYSERDAVVTQPFVRRPLAGLPFLSGAADAQDYSDIANPYGFGGPLSNVADPAAGSPLYARFDQALTAWCEAEQVASEFAVLHPFMADHQLALLGETCAPRHEKDAIYIDLSKGEDGILAGINRGHRSSINKARRAGLRVEKVEPSVANLALFDDIYRATMRRQQAAQRWSVPHGYFAQHFKHLGPHRASLFFAYVGETVESAYLVIGDFGSAYYHFAGTRLDFPELRAANLTMYETALFAQKSGYRRYHLGGGVTSRSDDPLLRFKAGFSKLRAPVHTYFRIRDQALYERLNARKREHEIATTGAESSSGFVPIYRR